MLVALQHNDRLSSDTAHRYQQLAHTCPLVALLGVDVPAALGQARGVALIHEGRRIFEFIITQDRTLAAAAACSLAGRMT